MTAKTFSRLFIFPAALIIVLSGTVLSGVEGKIPITTSSEKALHYYLQGRDLAEKLQGQESLKYFEMAVEKDPEFAIAYWSLAFAQPTNIGFFEMFEKARAMADKASKGEQLMIKATEAGIGGRSEEQLNYIKELVEAYPNDERAHNQLGGIYFGRQAYAMAIGEYNKAIKINPEFSQPYNQLGYAHRFLENHELMFLGKVFGEPGETQLVFIAPGLNRKVVGVILRIFSHGCAGNIQQEGRKKKQSKYHPSSVHFILSLLFWLM